MGENHLRLQMAKSTITALLKEINNIVEMRTALHWECMRGKRHPMKAPKGVMFLPGLGTQPGSRIHGLLLVKARKMEMVVGGPGF